MGAHLPPTPKERNSKNNNKEKNEEMNELAKLLLSNFRTNALKKQQLYLKRILSTVGRKPGYRTAASTCNKFPQELSRYILSNGDMIWKNYVFQTQQAEFLGNNMAKNNGLTLSSDNV